MRKSQIPNPKSQKNSKTQATNGIPNGRSELGVGVWAFLFTSLLCLALLPSQVLAQTNSAKPTLHSNRYLLVVETSRAMQRRSDGVLKAVQDLLASGMHGQLRRGDTLGLWTYNEELYAGQFPLQQWTPETHRNVAIKVLSFLKGQSYEKRANLDKAVAAMEGVIKNSEFITVILISTGEQPIQGTPLDEQINDFHKLWNAEQQKARMPFITVLRATNGKIT